MYENKNKLLDWLIYNSIRLIENCANKFCWKSTKMIFLALVQNCSKKFAIGKHKIIINKPKKELLNVQIKSNKIVWDHIKMANYIN